ncbi:MAG: DUF2071 domain-containing protein [Opitutales bacterium]
MASSWLLAAILCNMRFPLQNHPFPVEAFFERSLVLTFAVPVNDLAGLIPECLTLDTFQDRFGFIAVAMVETKNLRPRGFPSFLGNDFFLIGYRIFVRYTNRAGRRLRGLYILRSETDKKLMELLGGLFTRYRYVRTDIRCRAEEGRIHVTAPSTGFSVEVETGAADVPLPHESPFVNWSEARRFAGPLPFTFSYSPDTQEVLTVQGIRRDWKPRPVLVNHLRIPFVDSLALDGLVLANAFLVEEIPYQWNRGTVEEWKR